MSRSTTAALCSAGLLLFAAMSYTAVRQKSATADEPLHALAAYVRTFYGDFRLNPDHPPLWGYWAMLSGAQRQRPLPRWSHAKHL